MDENGKQLVRRADLALLCIHACLLVAFLFFRIYIMALVNVVSVSAYACSLVLIKRNKLVFYSRVLYVEVWAHMMLAAVLMGWECGFQMFCFTLIPVVFYSDYRAKDNEKSRVTPVIITVLTAAVYLAARYYTFFNEAYYASNVEGLEIFIYTSNTIVIFAFIVAYMMTYNNAIAHKEYLLRSRANHDELTGLHNRYGMRHFMNRITNDSKSEKLDYNIAIIDIDDFKEINDSFGHNAGDYILKSVAGILKNRVDQYTKVCRWGGEEFLVLQFHKGDFNRCFLDMEEIRNQIEQSVFLYDGKQMRITITVGVADSKRNINIEEVIKEADEHLYEGKKKGKNCVVR